MPPEAVKLNALPSQRVLSPAMLATGKAFTVTLVVVVDEQPATVTVTV